MDPARLRARLAGDVPPSLVASRRLAETVAGAAAERPDHPPRALLVGGFVRDALLGRETLDADVEVHGLPPARLEEVLERLFPGRLHTVGRSFGIFKIALEGGPELDVSIPRSDSKTGPGHKGFAVTGDPFLGIAEAARRRDFTVNAIAADPLTGAIEDPWGGIPDLEAGMLRAVDPRRFPDDPLRVWRAVQFVSRLPLRVEPATLDLLREIVSRGELATLSRERVTEEWRKLLLDGATPSAGLVLAREIEALARELPEIDAMAGCPQEPEWHPEGDVFVHTGLVLDAAVRIARRPEWEFSEAERLAVALGALVHDVGKPRTTTRAIRRGVERIVSPGHESEGEAPARSLLARFTFGEEAERAALAIVKAHALPYHLHRDLERGEIEERAYVNAVRKLLKRIHPVPWRVLLAASEADWRGRGLPDAAGPFPAGDRFARTVAEHTLDVEPAKPLLLGRDVLALGVPPGPEVGRLLAEIEGARDRGEITTREEALLRLRDLVPRSGSGPAEAG